MIRDGVKGHQRQHQWPYTVSNSQLMFAASFSIKYHLKMAAHFQFTFINIYQYRPLDDVADAKKVFGSMSLSGAKPQNQVKKRCCNNSFWSLRAQEALEAFFNAYTVAFSYKYIINTIKQYVPLIYDLNHCTIFVSDKYRGTNKYQ